MKFNDSSNEHDSLYHDALFLLGVDSNAYGLNDFARNVNKWYYKAVVAAWKNSDDWDFDDINNADFPIATTTLVDSQADYAIPSNALKIHRLEVLDSDGDYHIVTPIDESNVRVALDEFQETDGIPKYFRLIKNSIVLYPAPSSTEVTLSAGLKLYFHREIDKFTNSDTTQEPGLPEPFHPILSFGAAYEFAQAKGLQNAGTLRGETVELIREMEEFFSNRNTSYHRKLRVRKTRYN